MARQPGLSVRLKLTLSYAWFLMVAGALLLAVVYVFLLRYVPDEVNLGSDPAGRRPRLFVPNRSDLERAFLPRASLALGALLVLGLAGGWFLAGRVLAPLNRITEATRAVAGGSLSHRIRLPGKQDEFRELADAFDAMVGRLEAHDAEQQRFAANASHELRTPLAVTQTLLDVARSEPDPDTSRLLERLWAVNARAIDITEALLVLSRADRGSFEREEIDLSLVAEEVAETLLPLAEERSVTLTTAGDQVRAVGSHALLLQLATNLVHNGIVHNLPAGGGVRTSTRADGGGAVLVVENTGPVVDPVLLPTLVEPFRRGTDRVRSDHPGVGLGLAIVRSITEAHDGSLTVQPRDGGGLRVTVRLPRS
ncbi:sensor histidine kinase [Nocardioides caldifontis]|uniref:sensor histidine kinase n=1 Tax=Nocardioides caldifontis TaxID=2588938 RepID=UPI0019399CFB|nr:HAMP domain-containing sensor histidine kinase [Nocardioides caldifontis]